MSVDGGARFAMAVVVRDWGTLATRLGVAAGDVEGEAALVARVVRDARVDPADVGLDAVECEVVRLGGSVDEGVDLTFLAHVGAVVVDARELRGASASLRGAKPRAGSGGGLDWHLHQVLGGALGDLAPDEAGFEVTSAHYGDAAAEALARAREAGRPTSVGPAREGRTLAERRADKAQAAYEDYEFSDPDLSVVADSGWERQVPGRVEERDFFYGFGVDDGTSRRGRFVVTFSDDGSDLVESVEATDSHGNGLGRPADRHVTVVVEGEASDDADAEVPGTYAVTVDGDLPERLVASAALDAFHADVGIEAVDDFSIVVLDADGAALDEDEGHDGSTLPLEGRATLGDKVS